MNFRSGSAIGLSAILLVSVGCSSFSRGRAASDPIVASHLTKGSQGQLADRSGLDSLTTVARKPGKLPTELGMNNPDPVVSRSHSADFSWIRGRLWRRYGRQAGWYIEYDSTGADPYGGQMTFASHPSVELLREGDNVLVTGQVVERHPGEIRYQIDTIAMRSE